MNVTYNMSQTLTFVHSHITGVESEHNQTQVLDLVKGK